MKTYRQRPNTAKYWPTIVLLPNIDPWTQGHEIFNLTEKELLYKQKIGMELLEVANIISPGISR